MIIEIIIILLIYITLMIVALYYYDLFQSKDMYSKDELKNILPYFKIIFDHISTEYSISMVILVFIIASIVGLLPLLLITHWIVNSALLGVILYLITPYIKSRFEETQVTVTESYADSAVALFIRYGYIIIVGFSAGMASAIIYNWAVFKLIHFLWLLPNLIALSAITVISMYRSIK